MIAPSNRAVVHVAEWETKGEKFHSLLVDPHSSALGGREASLTNSILFIFREEINLLFERRALAGPSVYGKQL